MIKNFLHAWNSILKQPISNSFPILFLYVFVSSVLYLVFPLVLTAPKNQSGELFGALRLIFSIFTPAVTIYFIYSFLSIGIMIYEYLMILSVKDSRIKYFSSKTWIDWLGTLLAIFFVLYLIKSWSNEKINLVPPYENSGFYLGVLGLFIVYIILKYIQELKRQKNAEQSSLSPENK